ncbi:MAG: ribosomal-processing cysteine protease Prp [Leptospirales bacterium]|nr:ribosomal-processing cysteine protease Prp [Leptospirales bacterium]
MIAIIFKNIVSNDKIDLDKDTIISLEVSGHSGLNKKGSDILCSAVSALSQTFILTVARILQIEQQLKREDGYLSSRIDLNGLSSKSREKLKLLFESLLIGLFEIDKEYPDKIKIEFVND